MNELHAVFLSIVLLCSVLGGIWLIAKFVIPGYRDLSRLQDSFSTRVFKNIKRLVTKK